MNISANSIRSGNILVIGKDLWLVTKPPEHTQPGKGPAYVQLEIENLKTGLKSNKRLRSAETVEKAQLSEKRFRYLYQQGDSFLFMESETFEQMELPVGLLGEKGKFLKDELEVTVYFYNEQPAKVDLPQNVTFEIEDTPPHVKASTAKASYKRAIVNGKLTVLVPPYLNIGDKIVVKTEDCSFVEKVD